MSYMDDARRIANGLDFTATTTRGKTEADVTLPTDDTAAAEARRVLAAFGREGWKTSWKKRGKIIHAEIKR